MEIEMKKLTATSLALTLALSCGATSVMASAFEDKDMAFAFESDGTMEVVALSEQEMKETEGAYIGAFFGWLGRLWAVDTAKNAAAGAGAGGAQYGIANGGRPAWNAQDQLWAIGSGAASGVVGGAVSNKWGAAGAGAVAGGAVDRFNSSTPSTNNSNNFGRDVNSYCGSCYRAGSGGATGQWNRGGATGRW
jgi:hypothetical protein